MRNNLQQSEGYSWLFFHANSSWITGLLTTVVVIGTGGSFYALYFQFGNDFAPDSIVGYAFAIAGLCCILLATLLYTLRRRSRKLAMGQLNAALNWHVYFAIIGITFLFMHSFGDFNAKTGTYALYSLIALVISGFVGRVLDRIVPWLIAREVDNIFTTQELGTQFIAPWDMAFIAPGSKPGSIINEEDIRNFMSNKHEEPVQTSILSHQALQHIAEIRKGEQALLREQFYRYLIHYWRILHIVLALLTIGLIIWHLFYVGQLLLNAFTHHG
ncbi:MAG TPA: hypothetical protein VKP04_05715 [Ktedonobacteraceae bacterium]|nr:hypothetical protein [Ktedonobacteraceae bacterium]